MLFKLQKDETRSISVREIWTIEEILDRKNNILYCLSDGFNIGDTNNPG